MSSKQADGFSYGYPASGCTWPSASSEVNPTPSASPAEVNVARKDDKGKPPLSMIPREALEELAAGFAYGAKKYSRGNFRESAMAHSRLADAAMRHIVAMANGEDIDPESGNSHLSHALCSLAMLAFQHKHHPEANDLYPAIIPKP
jgi:hypothetical protein